MQELLFLAHRLPYPPNKGDKIRSYHWLRALAGEYRVHLGTFIDDPADWSRRTALDSLCDQQCYRPLAPSVAKLRSLAGLTRGEALSLAYYRDRAMQRWVAQLMKQRPIAAIVVFSSAMAPYARGYPQVRRVLDLVDVDSEKWRQYAGQNRLPMRWIYAREARRLLAAERADAAAFDAAVFVSEAEAALFCERAPACAARVSAIGNGVDSAYFDPVLASADPYHGRGPHTLVFTGMMDYAANIDAITWFARQVLPLIQAEAPASRLCIVGARPAPAVCDLEKLPGVRVTGGVADVRPYLAHAQVAIAPMRIARGLQNKVLEALAMGKPVVLTPEAATGLRPLDAVFAGIGGDAGELARAALRFLAVDDAAAVARGARAYALDHYGWASRLADFLALVAGRQSAYAGDRAGVGSSITRPDRALAG
jgi:sugar transferase (PEP-CTERM/EpsH1 system associated)